MSIVTVWKQIALQDDTLVALNAKVLVTVIAKRLKETNLWINGLDKENYYLIAY